MVNANNNRAFLIPEETFMTTDFSNIVPPPTDKSVLLWRYLDLARLIALLSDKKLHFARADVFEDRHEGSITKPMWEKLEVQFVKRPEIRKSVLQFFKRHMKESAFVSCWCMEPESEAMWKLYCRNNYGVAITVVYRDIEDSFSKDCVIAPVRYLDYQIQEFPINDALYPLFHKRQAFAYEKEVRIIKWCSDQIPGIPIEDCPPPAEEKVVHEYKKLTEELKAKRGRGILLDFDVHTLVRNIVIHPYAPEWYFKAVKLVIDKFTPMLGGKVKWSSLRTEPFY